MKKKNVAIDYYSRDFESIKESLVRHAKRYYPDTFQDFSEAGFGSLMLDTVSYVGDVLSFYLDYQANESFIGTASEIQNVVKLARQSGYKFDVTPSSQGVASFFIFVPSTAEGSEVDTRYLPVLKAGSSFTSDNGANFLLAEDVVFKVTENNVSVGRVDENNNVTYFVVKGYGTIISGEYQRLTIDVGDFENFLKVQLPVSNISEIVSVFDREGNEYYEVEHLAQDIVYKTVGSTYNSKGVVSSVMRPFSVARRFVVERDGLDTYLQFGQGNEDNIDAKQSVFDPSQKLLKMYAKNYHSDDSFDPVNLIESDKFGIVPYNTLLEVEVRTNQNSQINFAPNRITKVSNAELEFENPEFLNSTILDFITSKLEIVNEEHILGKVTTDSVEEIKIKSNGIFAAQNRAVTLEDYTSMVYKMPNEFGSIKRVSVVKDLNSFKRNLNMYILSEDENGHFITTNQVIKENLRTWINKYKMMNDTIDILDSYILNIGVDFEIISNIDANKYETLTLAKNSIIELFAIKPEIGQSIMVSDIIQVLKNTRGVLDVISVNVTNKVGGVYSQLRYDLESNLDSNGRMIKIPENVVFELKYPFSDIKGVIV